MTAIGNADGTDAFAASYERQVALAASDTDGVVDGAIIGKDLLVPDPGAPFGLRLDANVVVHRFRAAWAEAAPSGQSNGGGMLVAASDLARVLRYRSSAAGRRYATLFEESIRPADEMIRRWLEGVVPGRDKVEVAGVG